jgi:DNA polymerase III epsilon subunit-like protein
MTNSVLDQCFRVIDLATTGLNPTLDSIVEVGWVIMRGNGSWLSQGESLVRPSRSIPASATKIHGIRDQDVADAPTLEDLVKTRPELFEPPLVAVAHKASFDRPFLCHHSQVVSRANPRFLCTKLLSENLYPGRSNYALESLKALAPKKWPCDPGNIHRAGYDARCTAALFAQLISTYLEKGYPDDIESLFALSVYQRMPFGKHRGKFLDEVPREYITWLSGHGVSEEELSVALRTVLNRTFHRPDVLASSRTNPVALAVQAELPSKATNEPLKKLNPFASVIRRVFRKKSNQERLSAVEPEDVSIPFPQSPGVQAQLSEPNTAADASTAKPTAKKSIEDVISEGRQERREHRRVMSKELRCLEVVLESEKSQFLFLITGKDYAPASTARHQIASLESRIESHCENLWREVWSEHEIWKPGVRTTNWYANWEEGISLRETIREKQARCKQLRLALLGPGNGNGTGEEYLLLDQGQREEMQLRLAAEQQRLKLWHIEASELQSEIRRELMTIEAYHPQVEGPQKPCYTVLTQQRTSSPRKRSSKTYADSDGGYGDYYDGAYVEEIEQEIRDGSCEMLPSGDEDWDEE